MKIVDVFVFHSMSEVFGAFGMHEKEEKCMREHLRKNNKHFVLLFLSAPKQNMSIFMNRKIIKSLLSPTNNHCSQFTDNAYMLLIR